MRSRRAIAVLLAGVILLGACSSEDEEWTDDDRGPLIALCETTRPDDDCEFLVELLEDFGCTLDDAAGLAADEELFAVWPMSDWDRLLRKYPSCEDSVFG